MTRKSTGPYTKVSATLEESVLRRIREQTPNVSGYLNDAAKRQLYFDMLRATEYELGRQGVKINERFYRNLKKWSAELDRPSAERRRIESRIRRAG